MDYEDVIAGSTEDLTRTQNNESTIIDDNDLVPVKFDYTMDNEDLFLLSFAPTMTRMTTKQNALARIRILEELFKLEFEDE